MSNPIKIMIVDDDAVARHLLFHAIKQDGVDILCLENAEQMFEELSRNRFSLIVLDVLLPGMDGLSATERLRLLKSDIPLILISARDEPNIRARGIEMGADDFMGKPFLPRELSARVKRLVPQLSAHHGNVFCIGKAELNCTTQSLVYKHQSVFLTTGETTVLRALCKAKGAPVARERLQASICKDSDAGISPRSLDTLISRLRVKLKNLGVSSHTLDSVRGVGYRLHDVSMVGSSQ